MRVLFRFLIWWILRAWCNYFSLTSTVCGNAAGARYRGSAVLKRLAGNLCTPWFVLKVNRLFGLDSWILIPLESRDPDPIDPRQVIELNIAEEMFINKVQGLIQSTLWSSFHWFWQQICGKTGKVEETACHLHFLLSVDLSTLLLGFQNIIAFSFWAFQLSDAIKVDNRLIPCFKL